MAPDPRYRENLTDLARESSTSESDCGGWTMWTIDMKAISRFPALLGPSRAFASDRSGSMIVLFALAAPIALGLAALGTEGGALYEKKAAVQAAADQAAVSAANSFNSSNTAYTIEGKAVAAQMGFVDGQGGVTVTVNYPPASGPSAGKAGYVEVIISFPQPPMLSRLFHPGNYTIDGRAVATYGAACVLALDPTVKNALLANGSTIVNMPKCNLVSDSNSSDSLSVGGSASVTVNEAIATGGINATSGLVDNANVTGAPPVPNPYAGLSVPATSAWGSSQSVSGAATVTLNPGWYSGGLTIGSSQTVTLKSGVYYIDGGSLTINAGAVVTGTGVTFVLTSSTGKSNSYATGKITGGGSVNITGPTTDSSYPLGKGTSGTGISGVVIFQDPNAPLGTKLTINGDSNTYLGGAIVA